MPAKTLMIQGSMSSVGKSLLVTALCRIFARQGVRVAPFKAQNMSNNAAVCADGGEIGRAQYTQALAAGITPTVAMNPVLLKPEGAMRSQVIVNGRVWDSLSARDYAERKRALWGHVTAALDSLRASYELVIIEGAGSPVELNLKRGDIVNMAVARYAQSPVLLAGDIDRGGIFAQLLGTLDLLEPDERALVRGLLVNKFRGDPALFTDGVRILEERGGVPVLGVIPALPDLAIPEEDAVALETPRRSAAPSGLDIAVIALPRIANFDDFDPLAHEPGVSLRYASTVDALGAPDAVILAGSKSTVADLEWLTERGLSARIVSLAQRGTAVVGLCGGYQMLGTRIRDPHGVESPQREVAALGLLPVETTFAAYKATYQATAALTSDRGWMAALRGQMVSGYEIHMGRTETPTSWLTIATRGGESVAVPDGATDDTGHIWGCYLHGLFANDAFRRAWLQSLGWQSNHKDQPTLDYNLNTLADHVEASLDMQQLRNLLDAYP